MALIYFPDLRLNAELSGPDRAPPVVLLHSLGTNLRLWDGVVARLPGHRILRLDMRGHGASDAPPAPYAMGALIHDVERVMAQAGMREAVVVGLSIGGMIAQGLAVKRLDLVRGMVLSNTAARIGIASQWQARIEAVRAGGLEAIADATLERWFGRGWRDLPELPQMRAMLLATPPEGWMGAAAAIAGTDFYTPTAGLTLPTLAIAGTRDGATPPDLVRETAGLILGSRFRLIRGAGHLPMVEQPDAYTDALRDFLESIGHV
ncbi:3-oxoadipate enol-lactonase [Pseudotabrizicola algicola]|uniref:3-oxoadipate enol-lactonase n=1 Tax=Pseudotabrizicola algicola TaxID=2709381 RepID=A0A6B3RRG0_9RHOB|nr:3-oxoadipate enol-lactonase [Pseudotabrizicola algicola]NEX45679.1 3-oxoadipate enol-lactonase [Pseudotabrizicola algicola]